MIKKIIILTIFFYILTLFQLSFSAHFNIFNTVPSFVLILVILINLFEEEKKINGILCALVGGFIWGVFSAAYLGIGILVLLAASLFIKNILKKHLQFLNFEYFKR